MVEAQTMTASAKTRCSRRVVRSTKTAPVARPVRSSVVMRVTTASVRVVRRPVLRAAAMPGGTRSGKGAWTRQEMTFRSGQRASTLALRSCSTRLR
jgi:hypothetical protein